MKQANTSISVLTALLVLFLASAAFVLSYDALHALALEKGIKPGLAWLWPLTLDAFMISASLSVLRASLNDEGKVYPWALVGAFTVASIAFNVLHAPADLLARAIFALPPAVVFLSFELLMGQTAAAVKRGAAVTSLDTLAAKAETKQQEIDALGADLDRLTAKRDGLKVEIASLSKEKRAGIPSTSQATKDKAAEILAERPNMTGADLGRALGRSESLGRKLRRELLPEIVASDNASDNGTGHSDNGRG